MAAQVSEEKRGAISGYAVTWSSPKGKFILRLQKLALGRWRAEVEARMLSDAVSAGDQERAHLTFVGTVRLFPQANLA